MKPRPALKARPARAKSVDAVPLLDLHRQYRSIRPEVLAAIDRVCSSQHFILGEEVEALEREVAAFTGATDAVGCASGTDALWLALLAAGVGPGAVVVTTAFSFFASASAIVRAGARPLFVDIDPQTLNIDVVPVESALREKATRHLAAILPVHLYGQCADMHTVKRVAEEFGVPVVEDAAQAIGAAWHGKRAGSLGAAAAFSFYPTKNLSAYGEAGLVTTNDRTLAEHMRRLRNHGSSRRYYHEEVGWNSRLDAIQAAVLRVKLPYLEKWNALRRERAATYHELFTGAGLARTTAESGGGRKASASSVSAATPIALPCSSPGAHHVFHQYIIRAHRRDHLRKFLADRKIGTEVYYPLPLHLQTAFAHLGYREGDFPVSERAAREVLALPMFPELTEEEQARVVKSIAAFYS